MQIPPHGYMWNDLIEIPVEALKVGDVFVTPGAGHAWQYTASGFVCGIGVLSLEPAGVAWTVLELDGNRAKLRSHTDHEMTRQLGDSVLRVLPRLTKGELRSRQSAVDRAAKWLEGAAPERAHEVLATIPGLNRSLGPDVIARMLRADAQDNGGRGYGAEWVAERVAEKVFPVQLSLGDVPPAA